MTTAKPERLPFTQSSGWGHRMQNLDVYSDTRCCYCGRVVQTGCPKIRLSRDNSGEWYVVPDRAPLGDEAHFGIFILPIGRGCLRLHPEFQLGLVSP